MTFLCVFVDDALCIIRGKTPTARSMGLRVGDQTSSFLETYQINARTIKVWKYLSNNPVVKAS